MPAIISVIVRLAVYAGSMLGGAAVTSFITDAFQKHKDRMSRETQTPLDTGKR